jgi:arylsulfatase A-like enzyme
LEEKVPAGSGEDSVSFLPALSGKPIVSARRGVIHHSVSGHFAYRLGKWKLALAKGSGGWSAPKENQVAKDQAPAQLYDLESDPSETTNLYLKKPEIVKRLLTHLEEDVARGRTTDGPASANDFPDIRLWKSGKAPARK